MTHDSRLMTHDSRLTTHNSRLTTHDSRLTTHDSLLSSLTTYCVLFTNRSLLITCDSLRAAHNLLFARYTLLATTAFFGSGAGEFDSTSTASKIELEGGGSSPDGMSPPRVGLGAVKNRIANRSLTSNYLQDVVAICVT